MHLKTKVLNEQTLVVLDISIKAIAAFPFYYKSFPIGLKIKSFTIQINLECAIFLTVNASIITKGGATLQPKFISHYGIFF